MNDNSQQRALVTVLFIPERKKEERTGKKKKTFLQDERSRKAEHFNAEVLN